MISVDGEEKKKDAKMPCICNAVITFVSYLFNHYIFNFFYFQVFVLDPAHPQSRDLLKIAEAFYVHSAPVR